MEIKQFRLIKCIYESGSLASASPLLGLTQSSLSKSLKDFENQVGYEIFLRQKPQWKLTQSGQELYHLACSVLSLIEDRTSNQPQNALQNLRIGTECYYFYSLISHQLRQIHDDFFSPNFDIIFEENLNPVQKVIQGQCDFSLVSQIIPDPMIEFIPIFTEEIVALVNHTTLPQQDFVEAQDFLTRTLYIHSLPLSSVAVYHNVLQPMNIIPQRIQAIPLTEVTLQLIQNGQGLSCLPKWYIQYLKLPSEVKSYPIHFNLPSETTGQTNFQRQIYLCIKSSTRQHFQSLGIWDQLKKSLVPHL